MSLEINFSATKTDFAPAERASMHKVKKQFETINDVELIDQVFSKIPLMFQILNEERQIIYINELLKSDLEEKGIDLFLGYRPGEVLECMNSHKNEGGCGTTHQCKFCGIINCIIEARESDSLVSGEAIFESFKNNQTHTTIYKVTAKPFVWKNETFTIVTLDNINDIKRKEQLERTFFHDLMNKITSISGLSDLLLLDKANQQNEFIHLIKRSIYDLANEINFQKNLVSAENDDLAIYRSEIGVTNLMKQMDEDFMPYMQITNKKLNINYPKPDLFFISDIVLLKRILTNLIKNAFEATFEGESVNVDIAQMNNKICFSVQNYTVIPEEIKEKIFKRTFSTKGTGRGIGTYSVKLFTEKYLDGKAWFTSDKENGTTFYVEFPLS